MGAQLRRIGLLTGGGDCPGLNGVIRAVVKTARFGYGIEVVGIENGYGQSMQNIERRGLDLLIVVGGDGSLSIAHELARRGASRVRRAPGASRRACSLPR